MKRSKAEIESEKFWEDVYKEGAKQRRIQEREQRENAKSSSSGGRARGGRSRGYFSSAGRSGGKSQGAGRTSRISSSSYCHKTTPIVKKIHPNSAKYNNSKVIKNALQYIAGLSQEAEQKNENVKMIFFNGNDNFPFKVQENQNQMYVELFKENLEKEIAKPLPDEDTALIEKTPPLVQHIVFSLDSQTTKNGKKILREEIANIEEQALVKLAQENEILRNHMILMARHDQQKGQEEEHTNGVHFHLIKSNYNTQTMELERDFWSKEQIRNLQREFAINCQNLGLDIKIPREYKQKNIEIQEEISEKQRQTENLSKCPHKVLSIEFYKNNKAKSIVFQNLENGEIFQRNDKDIGRFVEENDIKIDDEFEVQLQIKKEKNRAGKEYTTYQWQTPINRTNPIKERQEKEKEILKYLDEQAAKIKEEQEQEIQKEDSYKITTNKTYEGYKSIKLSLLDEKLKLHKTIPNKMKNWNLDDIRNVLSTLEMIPDFYCRYSQEEINKINEQKNNWQKEMEQAKQDKQKQEEKQEDIKDKVKDIIKILEPLFKVAEEKKNDKLEEKYIQKKDKKEIQKQELNQQDLEQKQREERKERDQKEREEKLQKLLKIKKIAVEKLQKEVEELKTEEDEYKKITNQTYQGYQSIKVKNYENEIQSLSRNELAGLGISNLNTTFEVAMDYEKNNKNYIYEFSSKKLRRYEIEDDDVRKQERDWRFEISKAEEQREKERAKQEQIKKPLEPKTQEQEYIKRPIEKPIEQEPKREFKPYRSTLIKKKDRGMER
ncbi:hypothetical protein [Campylobacter ureolyticus]|uniref:hypothetical protein n=1 Tax=Campylobacter ureolyticus TaxID=827 RepID=UPI00290AF57E|nr:hypothetical protein [Campylobacter ureolyticus]MDU7071342.1 hypothetical protein [Campylobacter ureolyticus]